MASLLYMVLNIYCYRKVTSLPKLCQCLIYIYIYIYLLHSDGNHWYRLERVCRSRIAKFVYSRSNAVVRDRILLARLASDAGK